MTLCLPFWQFDDIETLFADTCLLQSRKKTDFLNVNNANVLLYKVSNKKWDILLLLQVVHPTFFGNTL